MSNFISFLVIGFIIFMMIRSQKKKASGNARPSSSSAGPGLWNLQEWMDIAGELRCRYLRPENAGSAPALAGSLEGFAFEISPDPKNPMMLFYRIRFRTPCHAGAAARTKAAALFPDWAQLSFREDSLELIFPGKTPSPEVLRSLVRAAGIVHPSQGPEPEVRIPVPDEDEEPEIIVPEEDETFEETAPEEAEEFEYEEKEPVESFEPAEPAAAEEAAEEESPEDPEEFLVSTRLAERLFPRQGFPGQAEKDFFETVKGRTVEWNAVVKSAYAFSSDFVFGNGKGVRCTMDLCQISNSFGSMQTVRAVAAFPPETADTLRSLYGKEIRFRGVLLKFEPFSKEIYLSGGELL